MRNFLFLPYPAGRPSLSLLLSVLLLLLAAPATTLQASAQTAAAGQPQTSQPAAKGARTSANSGTAGATKPKSSNSGKSRRRKKTSTSGNGNSGNNKQTPPHAGSDTNSPSQGEHPTQPSPKPPKEKPSPTPKAEARNEKPVFSDEIDLFLHRFVARGGPTPFVTFAESCYDSLRVDKPCFTAQQRAEGVGIGSVIGVGLGIIFNDPIAGMKQGAQSGQSYGGTVGAANAYMMENTRFSQAVVTYMHDRNVLLNKAGASLSTCLDRGETLAECSTSDQKTLQGIAQVTQFNYTSCGKITAIPSPGALLAVSYCDDPSLPRPASRNTTRP